MPPLEHSIYEVIHASAPDEKKSNRKSSRAASYSNLKTRQNLPCPTYRYHTLIPNNYPIGLSIYTMFFCTCIYFNHYAAEAVAELAPGTDHPPKSTQDRRWPLFKAAYPTYYYK